MQNLAYKIDHEQQVSDALQCIACGEELTGPSADANNRQSWDAFWQAMGMSLSNGEFLCGACGEYLRGFFDDK